MKLHQAHVPLDVPSSAARLRTLALGLFLLPALVTAFAPVAAGQCSPVAVGSLAIPGATSANDVAVSGNYAYVAFDGGGGGLHVVDVSDPANPTLEGVATGFSGYKVEHHGTHAFVGGYGGVTVVDVSDPANPMVVGSVALAGDRTDVALSADGNTAYAIAWNHPTSGTFGVIDVSSPASPSLQSTLTAIGNFTSRVEVSGTTVRMFNAFTRQITLVDVSNPAAPVIGATSSAYTGAWDVVDAGGTIYLPSEFGIYEEGTTGSVLTGPASQVLQFDGDRAYTYDTSGILTVVDFSTPAAPVSLGSGGVGGGVTLGAGGTVLGDVDAQGAYAYIADDTGTLTVASLSSCLASLELSVADCQDDADASAGYQVEVELFMGLSGSEATGFAAFLDYDQTVFMYRGDLSSYTSTPFPLHITPIGQGDDGRLELDGSVGFGGGPANADALLATLVFDVLVGCDPATPPIAFETGGAFLSKLSLNGNALDTLLIGAGSYTLDDTAPVFDPTMNIVQAADASLTDGCLGAVVTFADPMATDDCDVAPVVVSVPASGSFFATGTTTVTSTATDACGNSAMTTFDVTVTPTNVASVDVELVGVNAAVTRCIHFVADDCSFADVSLVFLDHDGDDTNENGVVDATEGGTNDPSTPVRAIGDIELPCGEYTFLCAKDQQHTKWATSSLSLSGVKWAMNATVSLDGGDTDDDGDVDIDDVTLFLAQYGDPASPGGCPWDGTRDADFSNNGAVGTEDYGFLTANWLTLSECLCSLPSTAAMPTKRAATTPLQRAADLSGDGWVDAEDVAIFERRHGLPGSLSRKMRGL